MQRARYFIPFIAIFMFVSSCKKATQNASILDKQQFPVAVGDKWVYLVVGQFVHDTITISVVSKTTYPNDSIVYYTRSYAKGAAIDSGYVVSGANSFSYSMDSGPYNLFGNLHLTFPLPVGVRVQGLNSADILTLDTFGITSTFYGYTYNNLYVVNRTETSPWQVNQVIEIQPGVGIVQGSLWQSIPGFLYWWQDVYLLSYELH